MTNFLELYQSNNGLTAEQKRELVASLPNDIMFDDAFFKDEVAPSHLISILENYGPFWVTLDADPSNRRRQHAVVVSGISEATPENAQVAFYDVATGRIERSNFTDFVERVREGNDDLSECLIRRVHKTGEGARITLPDTYTIPADADVYILVAALNYDSRRYSFSQNTRKYRTKIAATDKTKKKVFIIVDFLGAIEYYENDALKARKTFTPVNSANYPGGNKFNFIKTSGYLSKNTLYALITDLGTSNPGQLKEAGIFSHAYHNGPILANTFEPGTPKFDTNLAADPNYEDLDCRIADIAGLNTATFKAAFASDGVFKIWGCLSSAYVNYLIKMVIASPEYKSDGTTSDDTVISFRDSSFKDKEYKISEYFESNIDSITNGIIKITMKEVKKALAYQYKITYAATLAKALDIRVQAALPGTYASVGASEDGEAAAYDKIFRISHDTKMNVKIFEDYFSMSLGDLKYGIYTKADVENCENVYNS